VIARRKNCPLAQNLIVPIGDFVDKKSVTSDGLSKRQNWGIAIGLAFRESQRKNVPCDLDDGISMASKDCFPGKR
jgi:hypothetical protein